MIVKSTSKELNPVRPKEYDEFHIKRVKNGYILTHIPADNSYEGVTQIVGVEESNFSTDAQCFASFLNQIRDAYGPDWSKWNAENVRVIVEPGEDTDGINSDEYYYATNILNKKEGMSWEEFGKRIHKEITEDIKLDQEFRKTQKLPGHYY